MACMRAVLCTLLQEISMGVVLWRLLGRPYTGLHTYTDGPACVSGGNSVVLRWRQREG